MISTMTNEMNERFEELRNFLLQTAREMGNTAENIKEKKLKAAMDNLVTAGNSYVDEISGFLNVLDANCKAKTTPAACNKAIENIKGISNAATFKQLIVHLNNTEALFEKTYREVLNQYMPAPQLRNILVKQLNGIKCLFMSIRVVQ